MAFKHLRPLHTPQSTHSPHHLCLSSPLTSHRLELVHQASGLRSECPQFLLCSGGRLSEWQATITTVRPSLHQGRDATLTNTTSRPYGPGPCQICQYDRHLCNLLTLREPILTTADRHVCPSTQVLQMDFEDGMGYDQVCRGNSIDSRIHCLQI